MKKFILFSLFVLCQAASLQAIEIEGRVAYFYPQDTRMREIYGKSGWVNYQIEAAAPLSLCCECSSDWDAWTNFTYYQKKGRSNCLNNKTEVNNLAITFGVKRYFDTCTCFNPYLGLGVGFAHVNFHDHSPFVKEHINRWGTAILVKSGIKYDITCNIFLDLFLDYAYDWFTFKHRCCGSTRNLSTGGINVGLGLGYQF